VYIVIPQSFRISVIFQPGRCANLFKNGRPVFAPAPGGASLVVNFTGSRAERHGNVELVGHVQGDPQIFMRKVDHEGG
jgi:hypothetical protein